METCAVRPEISVILPVFNGEETVRWTIDSVTKQTFQSFELICVNDCSTDSTMDVLETAASEDNRIRIFENEVNLGLGHTRNAGIEKADGRYIAFIDSDDFYEPDFLEKLYHLLKTHDADIAQCAVRYIYNDRDHHYGSPAGQILGEHCKYRIDIADGLPFLNPQAWNKLYRRSLFTNVGYAAICYEDAEILPKLLISCQKVVVTNEVLFNYNKRFSGLTGAKPVAINKVDWYLDSLLSSSKPYFTEEFLHLVDKWNVQFPRCVTENYKNFLRMLTSSPSVYKNSERRDIAEKIKQNLARFKEIAPVTLFELYADAADKALVSIGSDANRVTNWLQRLSVWSKVVKGNLTVSSEKILPVFDVVVPKNKKTWVFASWGKYPHHTLDNPRAIFERVKADSSIRKVVILNGGQSKPRAHKDREYNVEFVPLRSRAALFWLLRAGVIVTGYSLHNVFGYRRLGPRHSRQVMQLWHGIPIKKVGLEVDQKLEPYWQEEARKYSLLVSSSEIDRQTMIRSFSPGLEDRVKLTGLPRHDLISCSERDLPTDFQQHLENLKERIDQRTFILFAPTWRYDAEEPCAFSETELERLNVLLAENNAVLGIRLHPNMKSAGVNNNYVSNQIFHVDDIPDVSVVLRVASLLISDYSSIYVDYLLTDNPVILYTRDISGYGGLRGFNYEAQEFIPHEKRYNDFEAVFSAVTDFLSGESAPDKHYYEVKSRFLSFPADSQNSHRVLACF